LLAKHRGGDRVYPDPSQRVIHNVETKTFSRFFTARNGAMLRKSLASPAAAAEPNQCAATLAAHRAKWKG